MNRIRQHLINFTHLAFPFTCHGCRRALDMHEKWVCDHCLKSLPLTMYWELQPNAVEKLFWGKIKVENAASFCFYTQLGMVQSMIHALKYQGHTQVGSLLGHEFAMHLRDTCFAQTDLVIPVPLHASRRAKRGYNQCDFIVQGLAFGLNLPYDLAAIERLKANESQTRKGVYERWINVKELFKVVNPSRVEGKHVLLVDDVITTGATTEACAGALLSVPNTKVSIVTLACPSPV